MTSPPESVAPAGDSPCASGRRAAFLAGMSRAAATVSIIATDGKAGRAGVTVSAMSSVSADTPNPTLLVCVHHLAPAAEKIIANGRFVVNVLRDDQAFIADTFAGRFKGQIADKFGCAEWTPMGSGAPRVVDPLVAFDCAVAQAIRVGTHHVFLGEVHDVFVADHGSPLIYAHRSYGSATRIDAAATLAAIGAPPRQLSIGCFHSFGPHILPEMIRRLAETDEVELHLVEGDQRRVQESLRAGETELALLYDLDLPPDLETMTLADLAPYALFAADHPLAGREAVSASDLANQPMVLLSAPPSRDYFLGMMRAGGVEPRVAYRSASVEMVRGLVGQGLGYTLLATRPAADVSYDGRPLVARPFLTEATPSRVVLALRRGVRLSAQAARFTELCRQHFAVDA